VDQRLKTPGEEAAVDYDLLIKNGRIVDGSGMPGYVADLGIKDGKVAEIGRLTAGAARTIDATDRVVAPGFIDNHCHFDAQVTWDPLCTYSPQHGVTTVIFGNCSLGLAPARPEDRTALAMMLSRVEAIPMDSLEAGIAWGWGSVGDYLNALDRRLGINAGVLIGHSAVRRYVMGDAAHEREQATADELDAMRTIAREGIEAGALGLSFDRNLTHADLLGRPVPGIVAPVEEIYNLAAGLRGLSTGVLQCGAAYPLEIRDGFCTRMSELSGRPMVYNQIAFNAQVPDRWKHHLKLVEEGARLGHRVYPVVNPRPPEIRFTVRNYQGFDHLPTWKQVMSESSDQTKALALADPAVRGKLRAEQPEGRALLNWNGVLIGRVGREQNQSLHGRSIAALADERQHDPFDVFLDVAVDDNLDTTFIYRQQGDEEATATLLQSPYTLIGLSDAGAHVAFEAGYGYGTMVLSHWVRERQALSLEEAIRKLTFMQASMFGIPNRGLLWPGFAADVVVFDPETVDVPEPEAVHDLPAGNTRLGLEAQGIDFTIVNGQVLLDRGVHTGVYPGRVVRSGARG
jgi:N-acyl-D-aspartate/D-glutamate deacylase